MTYYKFCNQCNNRFKENDTVQDICDTCYFSNEIENDRIKKFNRLNCIHIYEIAQDDNYKFMFKCKECGHEINYYKWSWDASKIGILNSCKI